MYYQYVPITTKVVSSPAHNKVNLMQHYVMFVSDIWQRSSQLEQKLLHRNQCLQTDDDNRHRNHSVYRQMMTTDTETIVSTDR
jgi:hypothetical protein